MKHLPIPVSLQNNIEYKFFQTGHMVYVNEDAFRNLQERTAVFMRSTQTGQ